MEVAPTTLEGRSVRLEPLAERHAADLAAVAEPEIFRFLIDRPERFGDSESTRAYAARLAAAADRLPFAVVDLASGRAVGSSSYLAIRPQHRGLEIGNTWYARAVQGTHVNPEAKLLLLRHAFEALRCERVELKCDARNARSIAAMEKLGCVREGVLRRHMVLPDGFVRDTVMFSIVAAEWPDVRARLVRRLGHAP